MLSADQLKSQSFYAYRAGMMNVSWIAGILRHPRVTEGFIQQTNNLNQMIHFKCEPGVKIPNDYTDGQPIKIIARMLCNFVNGKPAIQLEVKRFEMPSIQDMPPRKVWEQAQRQGVPTDDVTPAAYREERLDGWRVEDTGNMGELAGFVAGFALEAAKQPGSGGCLVIYIRQTKDEQDLLPVRCFGVSSKSFAQKLEIGMPLYFKGRISVDIKNTGEAPDDSGILPTHKFQYLRVRTLNVAGIKQIVAQPEWVAQMMLNAQSVRKQKALDRQLASQDKTPTDSTGAQLRAAQTPVSAQTQSDSAVARTPSATTSEFNQDILALLANK